MIFIENDEYDAPAVIKDGEGNVLMSFGHENGGVQFWKMDELQLEAVVALLTRALAQPVGHTAPLTSHL